MISTRVMRAMLASSPGCGNDTARRARGKRVTQHDALSEHLFEALVQEAAEPDAAPDMAAEDWLAFALFWAIAGVVFLQFFTRYVLNDSLSWTEEIAQYALMVLTFWGSALAARRGNHIAVEFLLDRLPRGPRRLAHAVVSLLTTGFFAVLVLLCWQVADAMRFQPMISIDVPLAVVYYGILAGLVVATCRAAQHGITRLRAGEPEAAPDPSTHGVKL
jgi:TRAP-type C4-dicarboxylate transport system permease small subunit